MKFSADLNHKNALQAFERLLAMIAEQREKCPWCREQTMESLRKLVIEETFELSEAILERDLEHIKKELGDLLFHITFYARMAAEQQAFTITEVIETLCEKLLYRNPHVYGKEEAQDTQVVSQNWEHLKLKEKGNQSVLGGVPHALPSLIKAHRILEKAQMAGFCWQKQEEAWQKIQENLASLGETRQEAPGALAQREKRQEELGDLLFALVSYARQLELDPEEALEKANKKFIQKVQHVEQQITEQGKKITQLPPQTLQSYWDQAP